MAINWNQAQFVAPKIQINPEALPIEAMMNVGDELQKRYDVALDTDTKLGAAARNLLQNVADIDKPEAMKIFDFYQNRLKERAGKGNYQDMRFQTQADALDLKGMYEGLSNRKKELEDYEKSLRERKDISATKAQELLEMQKAKLSSAIFDPERRYVSNLGVDKRHFASDVEPLELGNSMLSGWKADSYTGKSQSFKMADGTTKIEGLGVLPKGTILEYKEGHGWEQVKPEDIGKATEQMFKSHIGFNAMVDRDTEFSIYKEPLKEGETLESRRQQVFNQLTSNTKEFLKDKFGYKQTQDESGVNFIKPSDSKDGEKEKKYEAKNTYYSDYFPPSNKSSFTGEFDKDGNLVTGHYGSESQGTQKAQNIIGATSVLSGPVNLLRKIFPSTFSNITEVGLRIADAFDESIIPDDVQKPTEQQSFIYEQAKFAVENSPTGSKLTGEAKTKAINEVATQYKDANISLPLEMYSSPDKVKDQTTVMFPVGPKNEYFNTGAGRFTVAVDPQTNKKYVGSDKADGASFYNEVLSKAKDVQVVGEVKAGNPMFKGYPGYVLNVDGKPYYISSELEKQNHEEAVVESLVDLERYPLNTANIGPESIPAKIEKRSDGSKYYTVKYNGKTISEKIVEDTPAGKYQAALNIYDKAYGTK